MKKKIKVPKLILAPQRKYNCAEIERIVKREAEAIKKIIKRHMGKPAEISFHSKLYERPILIVIKKIKKPKIKK